MKRGLRLSTPATLQSRFMLKRSTLEKVNGIYSCHWILMRRMEQVAAAEDHMRAEGKIDKEGHLKPRNNGKSAKKQDK